MLPSSRRNLPRLARLKRRLPRARIASHTLKNPLWARGGTRSGGGPLPAGRLTRGVGVVVFLVLGGLGVRAWFGQKLSLAGQIERVVRAQYLPQLEKQLGAKIEVGDFSTDWAGRVIVNSVIVGRDASLPTGALAQIGKVTLNLDLLGLAAGKRAFPGAISSVTLSDPQLYLERTRDGRFNLQKFFKSSGGEPTIWRGQINVENGRVFYIDRTRKTASGADLQLDARALNAAADVESDKKGARFNLTSQVGQTLYGPQNRDLGALDARGYGALDTGQKARGWVEISARQLAAPLVLEAALPKKEVVASAGTLGGRVQLAFDGTQLTQRGEVQLSGATLRLNQVREPLGGRANSGAPIEIQNLRGPLRFAGTAFETSGLSAQILGANWQLSGRAALAPSDSKNPVFDVEIATKNAPLQRFKRWISPQKTPLNWQNGATQINAHLRGTPARLTATGALQTRDLRVQSGPQRANLGALKATFIVRSVKGAPLAIAARAALNGAVLTAQNGGQSVQIRANEGTLSALGRDKSWEIGADLRQIGLASPKFGASRAQKIALNAATPDFSRALWRGNLRLDGATTQNLNRGLLPGNAARLIERSGTVSARAQFSGVGTDLSQNALQKIALNGHFALSGIQLDARALPDSMPIAVRREIARGTNGSDLLTARNLESDFSLVQGRFAARNARVETPFGTVVAGAEGALNGGAVLPRFSLALADFRLASARLNPFLSDRKVRLAGEWRGQIGISNRQNGQIAATFDLSSPVVAVFDAVSGQIRARAQDAHLVGALQIAANGGNPVWSAQIFARETSAQAGKIGNLNVQLPAQVNGARLANLRLDAASTGANWTAQLRVARAAVPLKNLGAQLRGILTVRDASALARPIAGGFVLSRAGANWGQSGRFDGTARLQNGALSAQILAREVDAAALQNLLQTTLRPPVQSAKTRFVAPLESPASGFRLADFSLEIDDVQLQTSSVKGDFGESKPRSAHAQPLQTAAARRDDARALPPILPPVLPPFLTAAPRKAPPPPTRSAPQKRVAPLGIPQISGKINALVTIAPREPLRVNAQLAAGALRVGGERIGLQKFAVAATLEGQTAILQSAVVWSEGARVTLSGEANVRSQIARAQVRVFGARLNRLRPFLPASSQGAALDGLADLSLNASWNPGQGANIEGALKLRAVTGFGVNSSENSAKIAAFVAPRANWQRGWNAQISDWRGQIEGAPFSASASVSADENRWKVVLSTQDLPARRLALLRARQVRRQSASDLKLLEAAPPLDGVLSAEVNLTGALRAADGKLPLPDGGFARVSVPEVFWQGRSFGALRGDFVVEGDRLKIQTLALDPTRNGGENARTPEVSLTGSVPLNASQGEIDTQIHVGAAPIAFFLSAVRDGRDALGTADIQSPILDQAVSYVESLPDDLRGLVALDGAISGPLKAPELKVSNLNLRGGQVPLSTGGFSPPASFDSAFTFIDGVLKVDKAEFRLAKTAADRIQGTLASEATDTSAPADDEEDDDTIFTIEPGAQFSPDGPILAVASVINANLSQIAPYVPALRDPDGTPILRGELAEFSLRLDGTTSNPSLTGSIQGRDLSFKSTKIEALRVSRFEIANGLASVAPGNLTIRAGSFQSSAASGSVAWDWAKLGPVMDGPLNVDFPLQTRDFGALAGIFVPQLASVDADDLNGLLQVRGTLAKPEFAGKLAIAGGRLRLAGTGAPLALGLKNLNGAISFENGDRLVIDPQNPLTGELVEPDEIARTEAGTRTTKQPAPKIRVAATDSGLSVRGKWRLQGSVSTGELKFDEPLSPLALARLRYDLKFDLENGAVKGTGVSGLQNIAAGAVWRTGAGEASKNQVVRWMAFANGISPKKKINNGEMRSIGAFLLREDFVSGLESLARSRALNFEENGDFDGLAVTKRFGSRDLPDLRPQIQLRDLYMGAPGLGFGLAEGRLVLDNGQSQQKAPENAARLQTASALASGTPAQLFGPRLYSDWNPLGKEKARTPAKNAGFVAIQDGPDEVRPLRLGGVLTVHDAEIMGAGASSGEGGLRLSLLPAVPRFDVRLQLGRNVQVINSVIRARLDGEAVLTGTPRDPMILGTFETLDGQVRFPSARARIEEGRVAVAISRAPEGDDLQTRLDVDTTARGQAGRYAITLRLRGPLDLSGKNSQNLKIEVTSNPPLSQDEAFKQLLGISPRETANADGTFDVGTANEAYVSSLVNFISAPFFAGFERSVAQALGLSNVTFDYRLNEPLAVELNRAIGDRVLITYRRSVGNGNNNSVAGSEKTPYILRIDYRLKGDLLLGLQTDERDIRSLTLQKSWRF